jgi:hypothetical protein
VINNGIWDGAGEYNAAVLSCKSLTYVILLPMFDQWEPEVAQPHQRNNFFKACRSVIIVGRTTWRKAGFSMIQNP